jgi:hypothetical protein
MKYWFTIRATLTEEQGRALWDEVSRYNANVTLLPDRVDIYGDSDDPKVHKGIAEILKKTGYPVEGGKR